MILTNETCCHWGKKETKLKKLNCFKFCYFYYTLLPVVYCRGQSAQFVWHIQVIKPLLYYLSIRSVLILLNLNFYCIGSQKCVSFIIQGVHIEGNGSTLRAVVPHRGLWFHIEVRGSTLRASVPLNWILIIPCLIFSPFRHTVGFVADHWSAYRSHRLHCGDELSSVPMELPSAESRHSLNRLQLEFDQFVLRSIKWILTAQK